MRRQGFNQCRSGLKASPTRDNINSYSKLEAGIFGRTTCLHPERDLTALHEPPPKSMSPSISPEGPRKIGQLLVEKGWITGEQLIRAIQSQRMVGGRIGTCLLEMDVLSEDQLLDVLSIQQRIPAAGVEKLRGIEEETLELLPAKLASRSLTIPFAANRSEIQVATLNSRNLALLDEVSFCTNRRVCPHVASEVRILEALEKYYGVEIPRRFGHLLDRLNRSRYLWDESAKLALGQPDDDEFTWRSPEEVFDAPALPKIIVAPAARQPSPMPVPIPSAAPLPSPSSTTIPPQANTRLTLELVDRLFAQEQDSERIAEVVLRFAAQLFSRCLLLRVRQDNVVIWRSRSSTPIDEARLASLSINLRSPSIFLSLFQGAPMYFGPMPPVTTNRQLADCWGGELPQEVAMFPLRVRDRLVAILYGDRGSLGLIGLDLDELKRLANKASMALELIILRKKLQTV